MYTIKHKQLELFIVFEWTINGMHHYESLFPDVYHFKDTLDERLDLYIKNPDNLSFNPLDYEVVEVSFNKISDLIKAGNYVRVKDDILNKLLPNKQQNYTGIFEAISWETDCQDVKTWYCINVETKICINIPNTWLELSGHIKV